MKPLVLALVAVPMLAACVAPPDQEVSDAAFCSGAAGGFCAFVNAPLRLASDIVRLPKRPYPFQPLAQDLNFVDARQRLWIAPKGILTDGASIPPVFTSVVGRPTDPAFAKAAAIHDSYCGVGNEDTPYFHTRPWRDTHRMFYEALRVGGTPEKTAKTMYAAVYMGGPRWLVVRTHPSVSRAPDGAVISTKNVGPDIDRPDLAHIPEDVLQGQLQVIVDDIRQRNIPIAEIEAQVDAAIDAARAQFSMAPSDSVSGPDPDGFVGGDDDVGDYGSELEISDELSEV